MAGLGAPVTAISSRSTASGPRVCIRAQREAVGVAVSPSRRAATSPTTPSTSGATATASSQRRSAVVASDDPPDD